MDGQNRAPPEPPPQISAVVAGLLARFRLVSLLERGNPRPLWALFAFLNGCLTIGVLALVAWATRAPFIFPSLGPTAFLFFSTPLLPTAAPRNAVLGHLIGAVMGYASLALFGLLDAGPALAVGVSPARIAAAALSLGATSGLMIYLRTPHPPAGATTLIVSLGILRRPADLAVLLLAVVVLALQAIAINRLAGIDYPVWRGRRTMVPLPGPDAERPAAP